MAATLKRPRRWKTAAATMRMAALTKSAMHQRQRRVDIRHVHGLALAFGRALVFAALHDGGMQIEIVGHYRRAEDADGDV